MSCPPNAMDNPDSLPTHWTLIHRLRDWDDQESWREFFETYWRLIYGAALKAGLTETEAQEVVQETAITVAKGLRKSELDPARGSFKGWLLHTTRWKIADQFRTRTGWCWKRLGMRNGRRPSRRRRCSG